MSEADKFKDMRAQVSLAGHRPFTSNASNNLRDNHPTFESNVNTWGATAKPSDFTTVQTPQNFRIYSCQRPFGIRNLQPNRFTSKLTPADNLEKLYQQENRKFVEDFRKDKERVV